MQEDWTARMNKIIGNSANAANNRNGNGIKDSNSSERDDERKPYNKEQPPQPQSNASAEEVMSPTFFLTIRNEF